MSFLLKKRDLYNLYEHQSNLRWGIVMGAITIVGISIFYTNMIVTKLKEREKKNIRLYAKTLEFTSSNNITINDNINFISEEIINLNNSIPIIIMDSLGAIYGFRNIDVNPNWTKAKLDHKLRVIVSEMGDIYPPIKISPINSSTGLPYFTQYLYYKNSKLLTQLIYFPYVQILGIIIFLLIVYIIFSYSRTAEQNRVWIGMAKETAHQLGTPISSLMAWIEHLRASPKFTDHSILTELDKDVQKLGLITERFSNIGSIPKLEEADIIFEVNRGLDYLRSRVSSKIEMSVKNTDKKILAQINKSLFEWVIENICKNAVDAMDGVGKIEIKVIEGSDWRVFVDISDTGKGIDASKIKKIFNPGFTSKKRGWGLGLALVKRIIEHYHKGKVFVKSSSIGEGTTFRITLNRNKKVYNGGVQG